MKKLVYPFVLWALFAGAAQAQDAAKLAQSLVKLSGLEVQLRSVPKGFEEQMGQLRGKVPDDLRLALAEAGREAYRPELMAPEIAQTLAQTLKPAEMQKVLAWLETDAGRRVTSAEERASSTRDAASLKQYAEQTKNEPPSARRQQLVQDMVELTALVELGANLAEGIVLGLAIGADSMQPVQKRVGAAFLRKEIERALPKEKLREVVRAAMPAIVAYNYREVSDADFAAYVAFLRSADGKRYNDAMTAAYTQAMVAASMRMGQLVGERAPKRPT